jgi:N-acetylneuraminic acid mutarotase
MKRKRTTQSALLNPRALIPILLCTAAAGLMLSGTLLAFFRPEAPAKISQRTLTFAERVAYQRMIEEVYWRHRIWPKERPDLKPSLDAVVSQAQLEKKVTDYLRKSQALEDYWQRPITADQLQAEMNRMASHTKQPEVLRELFEALGNDPFVIAECLARPVLAERTLATVTSVNESWVAKQKTQVPATMAAVSAKYTLPVIATPSGGCIDNNWTPTNTTNAPDARTLPTAVWTGSEMIVWGGWIGSPLNTGGRYNPSTDSWTATSMVNAPSARADHTAVWTGSEMIVWGGTNGVPNKLATGGRYNPSTDTWTPTSTTNVPEARNYHTAVWTGTEMIVWGGQGPNGFFNDGARYNPSTDSWTAINTTNAPEARINHTAVWTGSEMVVWGGVPVSGPWLNTGGRYNPSTDTWTATSLTNVPAGRQYHTAVWTGSEMIVWGGFNGISFPDGLNTGGRYNPSTDSWTATSTINAPDPRYWDSAVWTGSEMIVWGGYDYPINNSFDNGGRYNPSTDTWTATSTTGAPQGRSNHIAVWTGSQMIVWGGNGCSGYLNTGGRYCAGGLTPTPTPTPTASPTPVSGCIDDTWAATSTVNAPDSRDGHTAVWTGSEMIVWGGENSSHVPVNTGGRYNPATDSWTATTATNAPSARVGHTAVWTGTEMTVWGGFSSPSETNTGAKYNPTDDSWIPTSTVNAPTARQNHTAVWTGSEMIVWGGYGCGGNCNLNSGGRYNPTTNTWTPTSTLNVPSARWDHTAVWTGSEMIVWGGTDAIPNHTYLHTGGRYNPATDSWMPTSVMNVPLGRIGHTAVWTGSDMIVWGGVDETFNEANTGGRYNPNTDGWTATSLADAPLPRAGHTAVWTGSEMIVWSGYMGSPCANGHRDSGGRYEPTTDSWTSTSTANAPEARDSHTAVWTGGQMIVWGGEDIHTVFLNTGGKYCAQAPPTPTPTPTATASPTPTPTATFTPTPTPTATATATPTLTSTPTPTATPRATSTPRLNPTPRSRPTPPPRP